jgi:hypothetical protein
VSLRRLSCLSLCVLGMVGTSSALAVRAPTYLEKVTIMDAFNTPDRAFASRCVRVIISTVDPRYAMLTSPARPPKACVQAAAVGDG